MATYREIQDYIKRKYGHTVKPCWIAHVEELIGLEPRVAPNRISVSKRQNPCPQDKRPAIEDALRHFQMIRIKSSRALAVKLIRFKPLVSSSNLLAAMTTRLPDNDPKS